MEYLEKEKLIAEIDDEIAFWSEPSDNAIARSYDECMIAALEAIKTKIKKMPSITL